MLAPSPVNDANLYPTIGGPVNPTSAYAASDHVSDAPMVVHAGGDSLQMVRVYAGTIAAQVVDAHALRYWPFVGFVAKAVGAVAATRPTGPPIAVFIKPQRPVPAAHSPAAAFNSILYVLVGGLAAHRPSKSSRFLCALVVHAA